MYLLAMLAAALAVCSLAFYLFCWLAARDFRKQPIADTSITPPVSILKPLKGCDPEMYESLRSHCLQDYPQFEIIFGVNDVTDSAVSFVERLRTEFPNVLIQLIVSKGVLGANRKVSNLLQMAEKAQYSYILINDGDIRVPEGYLGEVMSHFAAPKVGLITCLYRGVAAGSVWSKLEALGITADFMPSVLVASYFAAVDFALGSTLAASREALNAIGGFAPLLDYLADDYEMGSRISRAGYKVVIAKTVVETFLPDYDYKAFFDHQLRWGRTVRNSRPAGYFGMAITFGLLWAMAALFASRFSLWSVLLLACVMVARAAVAVSIGNTVLGDRKIYRQLFLLPVRDLITPLIWLVSMFGDRITWRGDVFTVRKGKLTLKVN